MSQMPGSFTSDVREGHVDNKVKEPKSPNNNNNNDKDHVAMKGSTSLGIPNPTGAAIVDSNPSPPNPWENKSPFDVNTGTGPWDGVKDDKPDDGGPVIVDNSLPANAAVQPQAEHHQQIRDGREAVKEPADDVTGETRATSSPEQAHSPSQNKRDQELAALTAITGGQPRPYREEENAGRSLAERSHGDRLARHEQPQQHEKEQERHHEKQREQERHHGKQREQERQHEKERELERQREKEREQKRRREEEHERQNAQQFKQRQLPSEQARDEHDRTRRVTPESESSNEELHHDSREEHPNDHNQSRLGKKKSKASATVTKAMGTLKEKVGKLVHHEKTADKGTEQKMVGDTRQKLATADYS